MTIKTFLPIIFAASLFGAAPAAAKDLCGDLHRLAGAIMEMRQDGVPLPEAMDITDGDTETDLAKVTRHYVQLAYEVRRYAEPELQKLAISEFANDRAARCYQALEE